VSFLKELAQKNQKVAPIISTVVCVAIGWERAQSYAQSQNNAADRGTTNPSPAETAGRADEKGGGAAALDLPPLTAERDTTTAVKGKKGKQQKAQSAATKKRIRNDDSSRTPPDQKI